ncbi:MAG: CapA family protein [Clostridiales bacterium]|nr:CapA family protein [Clostridiales bacterium]
MRRQDKRGISVGTVAVLVMTCLVLAGTVLIWLRLSSGRMPDLSHLHTDTAVAPEGPEDQADEVRGQNLSADPSVPPASAPTSAPSAAPAAEPEEYSFTLTVAGTAAVEGEVRKNSYVSELKTYDLSDIMTLLKSELRSDLNVVFLENIISDDLKVSDTVITGNMADMLKAAGFNMAACGFSLSWYQAENGVSDTRMNLLERGIRPVGIYDENDQNQVRVSETNGVRYVILQYTDTIASGIRKKMAKNNMSGMVPEADPEAIAADIAAARSQGARAVIVLISWGKVGKAPDKAQKALARKIADAGADLIIGSGSRIPQGVEYLSAVREDGSTASVPCAWSLGTTLSAERGSARRLSGYLLHVTVSVRGNSAARIGELRFTPVYTWKYKQDGRFYYRCLASGGSAPDGMDSDQAKMMKKAYDAVTDALKDSPVTQR